jgi:uncharacterized protein
MKPDNQSLSLKIEVLRHFTPSIPFTVKAVWYWLAKLSLIILLIAPTCSSAQTRTGYPEEKNLYVNDFANILTAGERNRIRQTLTRLRSNTNIEAMVVTISSISRYKTNDRNIESFATNLFNTWGIGDSQRNDGILILVAIKDRKVRIEVGSGYGKQLNSQAQTVIDSVMLPHFRNQNYSLGIMEGTDAFTEILFKHVSTAPPPVPAPTISNDFISPATNSSDESTSFLVAVGLITAILIGTTFGLIWYRYFRGVRCPHCKEEMIRLKEGYEDEHLDAGQKLESSLGSVNYQVWGCPNCLHHTFRAHNTFFSSFSKCHACGYRTRHINESIISHPTYHTPGRKVVTQNCRYCGFLHQETILLPILQHSTHHHSTHHHHSHSSDFGSDHYHGSSSSSFGFDSGSSSSSSSSFSSDSGSSSSSSSSDSSGSGSSSGDGASGSW